MGGQVTDDFWSLLHPDDAAALAARGVWRSFERGQAIWHAGQLADRVLIVRSGRVKITRPSAGGRDVILAFNGPGDLIGELAALDEGVRSAAVTAFDPVEVLALSPGDFRTFIEERPSVSLALLRLMGRRLRYADEKLMEFASFDTLGRVAVRLVELCDRFGESDGVAVDAGVPLSQEELAGWSCASLESVARALHTMRSLGWIETRRRAIRVLDVEALRQAAAQRVD